MREKGGGVADCEDLKGRTLAFGVEYERRGCVHRKEEVV